MSTPEIGKKILQSPQALKIQLKFHKYLTFNLKSLKREYTDSTLTIACEYFMSTFQFSNYTVPIKIP